MKADRDLSAEVKVEELSYLLMSKRQCLFVITTITITN